MKSKKLLRWVGIVVALSLLFVACAPQAVIETVEVPVEVVKEVEVPVEVIKEVEVPVEVEKIVEVPMEPGLGGPIKDTDTLIMAIHKAAPTLNPLIDSVNYFEPDQIFDEVVDLDANLKPTPSLATEWKLLDDNVTYEFTLREGVKFHNGEDFTCEDVEFSLDTMLDPALESRRAVVYFSPVTSYECVDDFTFRLTLAAPAPAFIANNFIKLQVVPADTYKEMGAEQFGITPVGTGPYKLIEWVQGSNAVLEGYEDYWDGAPDIKHVEMKTVIDPTTRVALFLSDEVDWIFAVPAQESKVIGQIPGFEVLTGPTTNMIFIGMNAFKEPFTDKRVRQAMNYAVDWDTIIETILDGYGYRNAATAGSMLIGYDPSLEPYPYDPEKAKELLAEAGYPDGFEVMFDGPVGRYIKDKEVSEAVAGYLNEIGISTQMNLNEWGTFWERFLGKEIPGLYFLGCGGSADFDLCNRLHFHSLVRGIYYNTPEGDVLLDEISSTLDPEERLDKIHEFLQFIQDEAPWVFAYDEANIVASRIGLKQEIRPDLIARANTFSWE